MSADSIYSDDWNSSLTGSQMNAWNLEDDITRIGSKAEDYLSGIWGADNYTTETSSRRKAFFNQESSDPFRRFQTPPPSRTSPTPLTDLYSQSIYQAEVESDSWQAPESGSSVEPTDEEDSYSPNMKEVNCMPQDLFSFSQQETACTASSSLETLNSSHTETQDNSIVEEAIPSSTEISPSEYAPQLIYNTTKEGADRPVKRPLMSLSIGMSICGVGMVFGSQIMHNATLVNPGKSLIIAGLIGLFASVVLQTFNRFSKRRMA